MTAVKDSMIFNRPGPKAGSIHGIEVCVCLSPPHIFDRPGVAGAVLQTAS